MPTVSSDDLRRAADLLDRRPELNPISVSATERGIEMHLRTIPVDACDLVDGPWHASSPTQEAQHRRGTVEGLPFVVVLFRDVEPPDESAGDAP